MSGERVFAGLEKGLRLLAAFALALFAFQCVGVVMYIVTAWPGLPQKPPTGITALAAAAVAAGLARSTLWVRIYWTGSKLLSTLRRDGESPGLPGRLAPILGRLTRLLVASCVLDVLLLPAIFLMDAFFPFAVTGAHLGMTLLGAMLLPQAFGIAALVLAYLTHQYGRLVKERFEMKTDLDLTI